MEIYLYHNTAEPTRVDKTLFLDDETRLYCEFDVKPQNVAAPVVLVRLDAFPTFNYAKITELSRYYFIARVEILPDDLYRLFLDVDVLFSYVTEIKALRAIVARNQFSYNGDMPDDRVKISAFPNRVKVDIPLPTGENGFVTSGTSYPFNFILVTGGEQAT